MVVRTEMEVGASGGCRGKVRNLRPGAASRAKGLGVTRDS